MAARLAALRRARGLSMQAAARAAGLNTSTIYRIEHGLVAARESTARALLELYGVRERAQQAHVLSLLRGDREPGWFDAPEVPLALAGFLEQEDDAEVIYTYRPRGVPPLLQTRAYAEAAVRASRRPRATAEQVAGGACLVMRGQRLLDRAGGPRLWAVLDREAIEDPPLPRPQDRLEQLDALALAARRPNVAVQVARPVAETGFLYQGPPFTLLRFPERDRPDLLVLHLQREPVLVDDPRLAEEHHQVFARLALASFRIDFTPDVLRDVRARLSGSTPVVGAEAAAGASGQWVLR
ncbi:transcriptional regulator [Nonomuraea cavernae]|uniref:Transcriptional regulator n=1 Tax=Nonomuraea cavernae TaxID=2045107 RepID=A0A917YQI3_9ACTN|nr:transcriptional regulator [Nonomuraea cavernae]